MDNMDNYETHYVSSGSERELNDKLNDDNVNVGDIIMIDTDNQLGFAKWQVICEKKGLKIIEDLREHGGRRRRRTHRRKSSKRRTRRRMRK
jgi:hypothetical protein